MTIAQTTTGPGPSVTRTELDPRSLLVDVNIRTDAQLDKAFIASIKDLGVLVPITAVHTAAGEVRVRFGHRRTLAAMDADLATVPVEIVGDNRRCRTDRAHPDPARRKCSPSGAHQ
jgi:ParB family chromosome partitioning protein